jgi:hypothetical protein
LKPVNLPLIFSQMSLTFLVITKLIRRQIKVTRSKVSDRTEVNSMAVIRFAYEIIYSLRTNVHHFIPRAANGVTTYIPWEKSSSR